MNQYKIHASMKVLVILLLLLFPAVLFAKKNMEIDSQYVKIFPQKLTIRTYFSNKYTNVSIVDYDIIRLKYKPNTTLNWGLGASYKGMTLNVAYGFGLLNPERNRGKTRYLDLQAHSYKATRSIDFYGQFYKGFYLASSPLVSSSLPIFQKPDMQLIILGMNYNKLFNASQFSYSASLNQLQWQKKSASTPILGFETYLTYLNDKDGFVPNDYKTKFNNKSPNSYISFKAGPTAGYAQTFVVKSHLYFTGAAIGGLDFNFSQEEESDITINQTINTAKNGFKISPSLHTRIAVGYGAEKYNFCFTWVNLLSYNWGQTTQLGYKTSIGNYRLQFAKRFNYPSGKLFRKLDEITNILSK